MRALRLMCLAVGAGLVLGACGDDGSPTTPPTTNPPPGNTRVVLANPSFQTNIQEIFDRRSCSSGGCHGTASAAGLTLTSGQAFGNLVNVASRQAPAVDRVIPNDADASYLVVKIEGRQTVGQQMPVGGSPLDSIDVANIRNWINTGAANN